MSSMIMQNIILVLAIAIPVVLLVLLRTSASIVFLSLCAGALLVTFVGSDAGLVGAAVTNNSQVAEQYFKVALLLLPAILSAIFLTKSMKGPKGILNILPAIAVGLVGVLLTVPLLPSGPQHVVTNLHGWWLLDHNKQVIVIASVIVSLVILWFARPGGHDKHKKHGH